MPSPKINRAKKTEVLPIHDVLSTDMAAMRDDLFSHPYPDKPTVEQVLQHALVLFQSEASAFKWLRTDCPAL